MKPFLIIRSWVTSPVQPTEKYPIWHKVTAQRIKCEGLEKPFCVQYADITRAEALELIERHDMVKVLDNKDGWIYDTINRDFQKKYKGLIHIKED